MAKVWKKLQRSDSDYTGDVTGTVDGTAAATVKGGAAKANLGLTALGVVDLATPIAKGGTGETAANKFLNSGISIDQGASGVITLTKGDGTTDNTTITKALLGLSYTDGATVGGAWGSNITGRPTELTDGRVGTGLTSSGIVDTVVPSSKGGLGADFSGTATGFLRMVNGTVAQRTYAQSKTDLSLDNVDNTSDALKPVSTAQGVVNTAQGVTNALKANLASPTFTGTVAGVTKAHVGLTDVDDTSDADKPISTAQAAVNTTIGYKNNLYKQDGIPNGASATPAVKKGDLWMDTNDSNKMYIAGADGSDAITSGEWQTLKGNLALAKADVGLGDVVNQKIAINSTSKSLEIDDVAQDLNATLLGGDASATIKAAAVTTAEGNIIGSAPGTLNTLDKIAEALNDNPTYITSTIVDSIATKGKAPIVISNPATAPTGEAVGQIGTYGDQMYVVQDI